MIELNSILLGASSGFLIAFFGYIKSVKLDDKGQPVLADFDALKFLTTVLIGALAGSYAAYAGLSYDVATTMLLSMGITTIVEYVLKAILRSLGALWQKRRGSA